MTFSFAGTNSGVFPSGNIPPTNKSATVNGITVFSLVNGKIAEAWMSQNFFGLLTQLGIIQAPSALTSTSQNQQQLNQQQLNQQQLNQQQQQQMPVGISTAGNQQRTF